jgi:hypothetical protein
MNRFACFALAVMLLVSSVAQAEFVYSYDSGQAAGGITWWPGYEYNLNIFPTDSANNVIQQLQVAWGNLPEGTSAAVCLYAMQTNSWTSAQNHLLQEVDTTVTSAQANGPSLGYSFDGINNAEHFYTGTPTNINSGVAGETLATITSPVWSTYDITPTTITTPYFGVGTMVYATDANTICPTLLDIQHVVDGANISWSGIGGATPHPDLTDAGNNGYVSAFSGYGTNFGLAFGNNPFLIRAAAVPEPATMTLAMAFMMLGLTYWARSRRQNKP